MQSYRPLLVLGTVTFLSLGQFPALADGLDRCVETHQSCIQSCPDGASDSSGKASCILGCATDEATCVGANSVAKTAPLLKRKAEDLKDFLKRFLEDLPKPSLEPQQPGQSGKTET